MCTNPECKYNISDSFKFVNKRRRTTNATDMLIVYAYRDIMETAVSIANRFHVSDTHAHEVFDRYVKMDKLSLTDAICIDEVYLLQKYCWLILSNQSNIKYHSDPRMDSHFRCLMNTYDYEDALFQIQRLHHQFIYHG